MDFRFNHPSCITGMMVSGASPIYAGIYQLNIVAMILATWRSCQPTWGRRKC
jgi:ABC-type iron transport system FetAB permease component